MAISETGDHSLKRPGIKPSLEYLLTDLGIDIRLIISLTLISLIFIFVPFFDQIFIRYAFGLILVLLLPGYSFISAVFPGKKGLGGIERAILSMGFSIVLVPIMGFLLNYTACGISLESMTICIVLSIMVCCSIANLRRHRLPPEERFAIDLKALYTMSTSWIFKDTARNKTETMLSVIVIVCLLLSVMAAAYAVIVPRHVESYTAFYINGPEGKAENYPTQFILGDQKPIIIGIVNEEQRDVPYTLYVTLNNSRYQSTLYSDNITLANNQTWEKLVYLKPSWVGTNMTVDFMLYADGNMTAPYRTCTLAINVSAPENSTYTV